MNDSSQDYLEFAIDVIEQAGRIALPYFRAGVEVRNKAKKRSYDPVTRADTEVEQYIRKRIAEAWPQHGIFGEEFGAEQDGARMRWLIDPIDGTRGFITGTPMWGVLLGLMDGERCVAGLMHQPYVGETYAGGSGGAFHLRNGTRTPLHVRDTRDVSEAVLCCTHRDMFRTPAARSAFERVESACRFSRFGTDCYGGCLLGQGTIDLLVEADLEPYDVVPLIPIIEGAGGVITDWKGGTAIHGGSIVAAATPGLHRQALELLGSA